ncbi:hypothetical protein K3495_g7584 [Podosphaera aphanis]|nr:hypothetical protein K3495_g7584 [Podosphaera aphanis]
MEPLLRLFHGRFGYADDAAFFASAKSLKDCHSKLQRHLNLSQAWAKGNGITFDVKKTELIYFHNKRKYEELPLRIEHTEIRSREVLKWLGILFDRKLSFKQHVRCVYQRAVVVTDHVRRLCNTIRSISFALPRQAVQGCVFATLYYGAETWYGPQTSKWALNQIQLGINRAARAMLPVYKTFPIPALLRETEFGPASAWLDRIYDRRAIRIAAADPNHPLRCKWSSTHFAKIRRRQSPELSADIDEPPWRTLDRDSIRQQIGASGRRNGFESYQIWTRRCSPLDLTVFSDGALDKHGNAGAGYCVFRGSQEIICGRIPLGRTAQGYDAEIVGAVKSFRAACSHWMSRFAKNVAVCLDNEETAICLHSGVLTRTSSTRILDFQRLRSSWSERERAEATALGTVQVRWIPGHQGIAGNERANALANEASGLLTEITGATIARSKTILEEFYQGRLTLYCN